MILGALSLSQKTRRIKQKHCRFDEVREEKENFGFRSSSFPAENGRGKNTVNSCHCVLSATPKGSVCSMLKPKVDECNLI